MELLVRALLPGVILGGYYALVALGLSLVFGAMQVVNLAHGEILLLGGYVGYVLFALWQADLPWVLLASMLAAAAAGAVLYGLLLPTRRGPPVNTLVLTYGAGIVLMNLMLQIWGADYRTIAYPALVKPVPVAGLPISSAEALAFLISVAGTAAAWLILDRTWIGWAIRAVAQNRVAAATLGLQPAAIDAAAFLLGSALAGLGGALAGMIQSLTPVSAPLYTAKAFIVVVLGGLASVPGVLAAGLLLGLAESVAATINPSLSELAGFLLFLGVLMWRPQGLVPGGEKA